jgi:hypothetical protein
MEHLQFIELIIRNLGNSAAADILNVSNPVFSFVKGAIS